jgi:DNA-binding transcriptional regulator YhcF (GntR family)
VPTLVDDVVNGRVQVLGFGTDGTIEVDPRSSVAPYDQLRQQITALALAGSLAPGDRLPSIRQLANDLGIASGTVARAYRELESDGVVSTHGRHGTRVQAPPPWAGPSPALIDAARSYADRASRTGASLDDALVAVRVAFASERRRRTSSTTASPTSATTAA